MIRMLLSSASTLAPSAAKASVRVLAGVVLAGAAVSGAHAQNAKIGFVNTDRIFRDAAPAKAAQAKIEGDFKKRDAELQDIAARLRTSSERLDKDSAVLSETDRVRRQRELSDLDKDFQRKRREFQEDLNARKNEELQQVYDRANRVVRQVAEAEKYDAILQEAIYINPKHDITEKVIKALNSSVPAAAPAGK